jgi:putative hydrolase of the HAD superfamily
VIKLQPGSLIILDLDDTLYSEREFERSGFRAILDTLDVAHTVLLEDLLELSRQGQDVFDYLNFDEHLRHVALAIYRQHNPTISLYPDAAIFIEQALHVGCTLAIATEGRSVTQRNKISALGLAEKISHVLISEEVGYLKIQPDFFNDIFRLFHEGPSVMIGDNPAKDFLVANSQNCETYMLSDRGNNVHSQDADVPDGYGAQNIINSFTEFTFAN